MDDGKFCKSDESGKEVPNYLLDVADYMVDLFSSSSFSEVRERILVFVREELDLKMFREYMSSLTCCNRITNPA